MPDNPQHAPDGGFALSGHNVVALQGRDASAFAQAQFASDVAALEPGHWHWSCWLTPKGRVIAVFALLKLDAETLWLVLPDADPDTVVAGLRRFLFRSKVAIERRADVDVTGNFGSPRLAHGSALGQDGSVVEMDLATPSSARTLRVGAMQAAQDVGAVARWAEADIAHGLPRLPATQIEQWTPQQLSLERLAAYSVRKGCYPGQEIVARTHFLGRAKRGLALLEAAGAVATGAEVIQDGRAIGTIVSVQGLLALAVLPLERTAGAMSADGLALAERPLLGGLER